MRVRIDGERGELRVPTGWFARAAIPAYCVQLTVALSEEKRLLLSHSGIGHSVFFQAQIPPEVRDSETIRRMKADEAGLFLVRDLARSARRRRSACGPP